MKNAYSPEN